MASRFDQVVGHKHRRCVACNRGSERLAGNAPLKGGKGQRTRAGEVPGQDLAVQDQAVEGRAVEQFARISLDLGKALGDQLLATRPEPHLLAAQDQLRPDAVPFPLDLPVVQRAKRGHVALKRMREKKRIGLATGLARGHTLGHGRDQREVTLCVRHPAGIGITDHALRDQGRFKSGDLGQGTHHQLLRYADAQATGDQLVERKTALPVELRPPGLERLDADLVGRSPQGQQTFVHPLRQAHRRAGLPLGQQVGDGFGQVANT